MASINSSDEEVISAINITPLVDVVLVLLVIFLVTAPVIYQSTIQVRLPQAASGESSATQPLRFSISAEGNLAWNNEPVSWEAIAQRLQALDDSKRQETVQISADRATPHGTVVQLMDMLRREKITHIAISVDPIGKPPARS